MDNIEKRPESKARIRFHDCDPFNHLNNSRYIDYMITARGDQLIEFYDLDIYKLATEKGIGWVTGMTQIAYMSPATVMEEVIIQTRLFGHSEKTLQFEALMWNHDKTILKSVMWTTLVHYNLKTQKSQVHSHEHMNFFRRIANTFEKEMGFEERVKGLRQGKM